ncbi:MAG: ABC transporter ATP-binding protein [Candidatus Saganbacteria bacterium]|nr:ABC transporter ATP-binding protein [Candidatus Saganbacteria bacterium]
MVRVYFENVTKKFDNFVAVKDMSLEVKDREFLVLVGPSGCGKTTALRMAAGLEEVTEGKIYIGDKMVNDVPPKDRNIAMIFQNYALYPHMNVYDNMAFGLKLRKIPKKDIDRRVKEAANVLDLETMLDRLPKQLSGGQRQRVAVGRAIVREPAVFLMDEPLSNLDAKLRVQMRAELQRIYNKLKATIIYVTHDQVEAMTLGTRIAVILNGQLQQVDVPLQVYGYPINKFVAGFIGSPAMNFIKGKLDQAGEHIFFDSEDLKIVMPSDFNDILRPHVSHDVTFGIRPEDILSHPLPETKQQCQLEAKVDFRELMGSETYLYLKIGKTPLTARVDSLTDTKPGSQYCVYLNLKKMHVFDTDRQRSII